MGYKMKLYTLSEFSDEDKKKAKEYLKTAFLGFMRTTLGNKVDAWFKLIESKPFSAEDNFIFRLEITTVGNDILTAIGCAINDRESKRRV